MPTINVPLSGIKGSNTYYTNTIGTEGVGISYTITTSANTNPDYWIIYGVVNCTVTNSYGLDGTSTTVTPTNQLNGLNYWGFSVLQIAGTPSSSHTPSIIEGGELLTAATINGVAAVSGPFIRTFTPPDLTYGLEVFNSSGNKTLDLSSIYPTIYATGTASSMSPGSSQTVSVPGLQANGKFFAIALGPSANETFYLNAGYSGGFDLSGNYVTTNGEFSISLGQGAPNNVTPSWIVVVI